MQIYRLKSVDFDRYYIKRVWIVEVFLRLMSFFIRECLFCRINTLFLRIIK